MELIRTIKLKLDISSETIKPTIKAYTQAFNYICSIGWKDGDANGISLHHKTYQETRKYLPSQLAISARTRATDSILL